MRSVCESEAELGEMIRGWLRRHWDYPVEVSMVHYVEPRTTEQNKRLWYLHGLFAAHLNRKLPELLKTGLIPRVFMFTAESVHEGIFKPHYCGTHPDGSPRSSTLLNKSDFAEALAAYEADMHNEGVDFPDLDAVERFYQEMT